MKRSEMIKLANHEGLMVKTNNPRDGQTRYAFFPDAIAPAEQTFFAPLSPLFVALGLREAMAMVKGFIAGKNYMST